MCFALVLKRHSGYQSVAGAGARGGRKLLFRNPNRKPPRKTGGASLLEATTRFGCLIRARRTRSARAPSRDASAMAQRVPCVSRKCPQRPGLLPSAVGPGPAGGGDVSNPPIKLADSALIRLPNSRSRAVIAPDQVKRRARKPGAALVARRQSMIALIKWVTASVAITR